MFIRIGIHDIEVVFSSRLHDKQGNACNGLYDPDTLVISLDGAAPMSVQQEVLIHEILHACWHMASLWKQESPDEETVVSALGYHLVGVLVHNPWISEYLNTGVWPE